MRLLRNSQQPIKITCPQNDTQISRDKDFRYQYCGDYCGLNARVGRGGLHWSLAQFRPEMRTHLGIPVKCSVCATSRAAFILDLLISLSIFEANILLRHHGTPRRRDSPNWHWRRSCTKWLPRTPCGQTKNLERLCLGYMGASKGRTMATVQSGRFRSDICLGTFCCIHSLPHVMLLTLYRRSVISLRISTRQMSTMPFLVEWRKTWTCMGTNSSLLCQFGLLDMWLAKFVSMTIARAQFPFPNTSVLSNRLASNLLLTRVSPRWVIPTLEVGWGIATICTSRVSNYKALYAVRFLVGVFE